MKLIEWYSNLAPSFISQARGRRVQDSTRDKSSLKRQVEEIGKVVNAAGLYTLVTSDWLRIAELAKFGAKYHDFTMSYDEGTGTIFFISPDNDPEKNFVLADEFDGMYKTILNHFSIN